MANSERIFIIYFTIPEGGLLVARFFAASPSALQITARELSNRLRHLP